MRTVLALLALMVLTLGLQVSPGLLRTATGRVAADTWLGLLLVLAALGLALAAACWTDSARLEVVSPAVGYAGLGLLLALELLWMLNYQRFYLPRDLGVAFRVGVGALLLLAVSYLRREWPWPRLRSIAFLVIFAFLGGCVIVTAEEKPRVDVWQLQQNACANLLRGQNPYAGEYPHFYSDHAADFLGPEVLKDGKIQSFPYPPLSLLLTVPGYLLGDVRWSYLAALMGTAALMLATGRRLGLPAGHPAELAVLVFLCHPHGLLILEASWTEPFLALASTACLWSLAGRDRALGFSIGATVALKQYSVLALPSVWASGRLGLRTLLVGLSIATLTALPFLLWDPAAFWRGMVGFHIHSPFRTDCLSIPAVVAETTGYRLSPAVGFLGAAATAAFVLWRQRRGLANVALGSAAVFLTFFVFNKAAHLNYYWLAASLLALVVLLSMAETPVADTKSGPATMPPAL